MNIAQLQQEILRLKKEKDVCILAHSYQAREICEIADFTGDSYKLSVDASKADNQNILMCGVRFMAETCKILSPEKTVVLASPIAGCAMADQMDKALIEQVKKHYPNHTVVAYINTTASLKTICDVCVTSSSAVKIVNRIPNKDILFIPDCNLGAHVAAQCPDKNIKLLNGGCPIHACVTADDVAKAKALYPDAELLVHPECVPAVCAQADYIGSTSGIMDYAVKSDKKEFIIGTDGLRRQERQKGIYHRHRNQHCRALAVYVPRQAVPHPQPQADLPQHEGDHAGGRLQLPDRQRRRGNRPRQRRHPRRRTLH